MQEAPEAGGDASEFRVVVWNRPGLSWRARVIGADRAEHDFTDPVELACFLATCPAGSRRPGLR